MFDPITPYCEKQVAGATEEHTAQQKGNTIKALNVRYCSKQMFATSLRDIQQTVGMRKLEWACGAYNFIMDV